MPDEDSKALLIKMINYLKENTNEQMDSILNPPGKTSGMENNINTIDNNTTA